MFSYLIGTLDIKEKRTLIVYSILSVLTPVVDLFSISMMLPVMNQLVGAAHVSKDFVVLVLGMNILIILKGIFELYKSKILNVLLYDGAYHLSVRLYELLMKEDLLKHNHREAMQAITMAMTKGVPTALAPLAEEIKQLVAMSIPTPVEIAPNIPIFLFMTKTSFPVNHLQIYLRHPHPPPRSSPG